MIILHWVRIGNDWVGVDAHNDVHAVVKVLDGESFIRGRNVSQNASQKPDNIPKELTYLAAKSKMPNIISKTS